MGKTKTKIYTNTDTDTNDILFECDGITIGSITRYWIYILGKEQWEFIQTNMINGLLYISAYGKKDIQTNDVILFYMKDKKGKLSGFVAVGQTCMDMEQNTKNLRIFDDRNQNRFFTEISVVSIFNDFCKTTELQDTITSSMTMRKFSMRFLRGEGVFIEIPLERFALEIVKKLFDIDSEKRTNESTN